MHKMRQFTIAERIANGKMRAQAELLERMILQIAPGRERSLALTKLDEALMLASAAIAEGGITTQNAGTVKHQAQLEDAEKCTCECPCDKEDEPNKAIPMKDDNDRDLEKEVDALLKKMDRCGFMSTLPTDDYRKLAEFEAELRELDETYGNECNSINAKLALCRSILHDHANVLRNAANKGRNAWDPKPASAVSTKKQAGVTSAEENGILFWDDIQRAAQRATAAMLDKMLGEKILLERKDRPGV